MATPATDLKLYEIADNLEAVTARIIENDGVLTEELEAELDALEGAFEEKVERTALVVQELSRKADACKAEAERLSERADHYERSADSLKEYLRHQLARRDVSRVDGDLVSVRRQKASRPSIRWESGSPVPAPFRRYRVRGKLAGENQDVAEAAAEMGLDVSEELDSNAAWEELKSGGELPEGFSVERSEFTVIW